MNPWKGLNKLSWNVWIISITSLINRAGMMVLPFLALYMTSEMGVTAAEAGTVLLAFGLGSLISAPFAGKLSDKIGSLLLMKISLIVSGIFLFFYSLVHDYYYFIALTFVWAIISEAFRPASMSFISNEAGVDERKTSFALYRLAINLGMSFGPVLGGILSTVDFSLLFYVDGATSIIAGLFLIFSRIKLTEQKELPAEQEQVSPTKKFSFLPDARFLIFLLAMLPSSMIYMQHIGAMPLFIVHDLGYTTATFGILTAINTVMIIFIELPLNNSMKHWSNWKAMFWGAVLTAIGFGAMAFTETISALVITIIIWTFGEMILFPATAALAAEISPQNKRGAYMGFYQMTFALSFTVGPWFGTLIYGSYGAAVLWSGVLIFGLLSALMMLTIKKKFN